MSNSSEKYVLLTGSDLGDRQANLELALALIATHIGEIIRTSDVMETEPWGFESDTQFLNQAILISTDLDPELLLQQILNIEQEIGRVRKETQWTSRIIDIDILCAERLVYQADNLVIPHKHLHERKFALAPLCQLVPQWVHPYLQKTYRQLLLEINESTNALTPQ